MSVTLHTTKGDIKVEVFCESVPKTAENFLALAASGYFNSTLLHRNIRGFMVQGGDPTSKGKGGECIWGGTFEDEIRPALRHNARGILSMANRGPGTNGSQFFLTYAPAPHLDGKNTVFGRIIGGESTLDQIEDVEVDKKNRPREPIAVESVTIHANPLAER